MLHLRLLAEWCDIQYESQGSQQLSDGIENYQETKLGCTSVKLKIKFAICESSLQMNHLL